MSSVASSLVEREFLQQFCGLQLLLSCKYRTLQALDKKAETIHQSSHPHPLKEYFPCVLGACLGALWHSTANEILHMEKKSEGSKSRGGEQHSKAGKWILFTGYKTCNLLYSGHFVGCLVLSLLLLLPFFLLSVCCRGEPAVSQQWLGSWCPESNAHPRPPPTRLVAHQWHCHRVQHAA